MTVKIIDLRTLMQLDMELNIESIIKANPTVVVNETPRTSNVAAENIAQINEKAYFI
ncbi:transketolase C-terminal domain-containing protein [Paenibacillus sp. NRS-1760]|uniref:transketolase C-terminal domain-containing protein n=1 Tax=Paenibacillus sp. NRS-1760 TaxID=3233902 RepID=UPI003D26C986